MLKHYSKLIKIKQDERTTFLDKYHVITVDAKGEEQSQENKEKQQRYQDKLLELDIAVKKLSIIKILVITYISILWLLLVFLILIPMLPLLYFLVATTTLCQIYQVKLVNQSFIAAHDESRKKIRSFWQRILFSFWGIIVFFGLLPVPGWGSLCQDELEMPLGFIFMVIFQVLIAFSIYAALQQE